MTDYRYDTQLLIEGAGISEDEIAAWFEGHFRGNCLLVVGDAELMKRSEERRVGKEC